MKEEIKRVSELIDLAREKSERLSSGMINDEFESLGAIVDQLQYLQNFKIDDPVLNEIFQRALEVVDTIATSITTVEESPEE